MSTWIWIEAIIGILLIITIILQQKEGGLGAMGGGNESGEVYSSSRGVDAVLHKATVTLAIIFTLLPIIYVAL